MAGVCNTCGYDTCCCSANLVRGGYERLPGNDEAPSVAPPDVSDRGCCSDQCEPRVDGPWSWVVMTAAFINTFILGGVLATNSVLVTVFKKEFNVTTDKVALVGSVLNGTFLVGGPICSTLVGPLGFRAVAVLGGVLSVAGFVAASYAPTIDILIVAYGFVAGLGFCFTYGTSIVCPALYFDRRRPIALGVVTGGIGLGMTVFPFLAHSLVENYSWQVCVQVHAGLLAIGVFTGLTYRPLPTHNRLSAMDAIRGLIDVQLFRSVVFWVLGIIAFFGKFGMTIPLVLLNDLARTRGLTGNQAAIVVAMMGLSNFVIRVLIGLLIYKLPVDPLLVLAGGHLLGGTITMLISFYTSYATLITFALLVGVNMSIDAALNAVILARVLGTDKVASSFGMMCLFRGIAAIIGPYIGGRLRDSKGYNDTFYLSGSALLTTFVFCIVGWLLYRRQERQAPGEIVPPAPTEDDLRSRRLEDHMASYPPASGHADRTDPHATLHLSLMLRPQAPQVPLPFDLRRVKSLHFQPRPGDFIRRRPRNTASIQEEDEEGEDASAPEHRGRREFLDTI